MPLQLLIIGQTDRAEALPVCDWVSHAEHTADIRRSDTLENAMDYVITGEWIPDLIVIVQSWPDEHSSNDIARLSRLAPLARWVVCYGSWCESDGRTRDAWPLSVRIPLRSATSRLEREWRFLNGEGVPSIPMSASREERFAVDHPELTLSNRSVSKGVLSSVLVQSPDPEYRRYLVELVSSFGCRAMIEVTPDSKPDFVVFDLDPWNDQRRSELGNLRNRIPYAGVIGVMSLPSPEVTDEFLKLGMFAVLPKLGDQQRILDAILSVADRSAIRTQ